MYDVVVIGSGPGGYVAAIRAAQNGARTAVVESGELGGTCLNRGCIPTKALVRSAEVYETVRTGSRFGVDVSGVELNFAGVMNHKQSTVSRLSGGVEQLLKGNGVDLFRGRAELPAANRVRVRYEDGSGEELETKNVIIATGARPSQPPVSEAARELTISSDDALELTEPPSSMLVIGGGVLGMEFACIYASFGTEVEAIKRTPTIIPAIDDELSNRLVPLLKRRGIKITTGVFIKDIILDGDTRVILAESGDGEQMRFEAECVLVAMGRVPDFGGLDLAALGIEHTKWGIKVDDCMQTSVPRIYAIGDVVGRFYLASVASHEGIVAADAVCGKRHPIDYRVVPSCVFTMPEAASVGLKEKEAVEQGLDIVVSRFPYGANGKALAMGEPDGMVKIIAAKDDRRLMGVHILGAHATDLIHEPAVALKLGATADDLAELMHAHPTLAETIMEAAHGIGGSPIHMAPRRSRRRE